MWEQLKIKYISPIQKHIIVVYFILGLLFLISWIILILFDIRNIWHDITKLGTTVLLTGGVIASIVNSETFLKIFKNQLREIVYSEEQLDRLNNLETIWETVSNALCKQRFNAISKKVQTNIKKYFLPIDHDYYYQSSHIELYIEFDVENPDYIIVNETNKATIISEDASAKICYKFSNGIPFVKGEEHLTTCECTELLYNGKKIDPTSYYKSKQIDDHLLVEFVMECEGKTKYTISRTERKKYNLKTNCHRRQMAVWLYNGMNVKITYPKNLNINFFNLGTLNDWNVERKSFNNMNVSTASNKGLIYKNQGLMMYLSKI